MLATLLQLSVAAAVDASACGDFILYPNTTCDDGTRVAQTSTADPASCCAACEARSACRSWQWKPPSDGMGNGQCDMNTNPGTPSHTDGATCGIAKDVPPTAACTACMDVFFNTSIDGDAYRTLTTNTSDECCAACASDTGGCVSWKWTQLASPPPANDGGWTNCELASGAVGSIHNDTRGVISGKMKGAPPPPSPPAPEPPVGPGGYIGCFVDLPHGTRRDLPFFFCSNGSDPKAMSGINYCAADPRLPSAAPAAPSTEVPSAWAGGSRMSPALCASLCSDFGVFAVQDGTICLCGSPDHYTGRRGYGAYGTAPEAECDVACSDPRAAAAGARCGGVGRSSIYRIVDAKQPTSGLVPPVTPFSPYKHIGCFPDQTYPAQANALPHFYCMAPDHTRQGAGGVALECNNEVESLPAPQCSGSVDRQSECSRRPSSQGGRSGPYMTLELCDALCAGFRYFAVQTGFKCYCGQEYGSQGNVSDPSLCHHQCTGNSAQGCGGDRYGPHSASSVYRRLGVPLSSDGGGSAREGGGIAREGGGTSGRAKNGGSRRALSSAPLMHHSTQSRRHDDHSHPHKAQSTTLSTLNFAQDSPSRNGLRAAALHPSCLLLPACAAPNASVDWSTIGKGPSAKVGATRDQGEMCDASWAFAAAAALESAFAIAYGKFVRGSPQSLLDCGYRYGANSCKGGDLDRAFMYAYEYGLCSEQYYRYTGTTCALTACRTQPEHSSPASPAHSAHDIPHAACSPCLRSHTTTHRSTPRRCCVARRSLLRRRQLPASHPG